MVSTGMQTAGAEADILQHEEHLDNQQNSVKHKETAEGQIKLTRFHTGRA
jgi:hypothetical protein